MLYNSVSSMKASEKNKLASDFFDGLLCFLVASALAFTAIKISLIMSGFDVVALIILGLLVFRF